jgi:acetyl-CoA acetyltransferase
MATDDIYILGIYMTKFGKYPDKDTVDLASEAVIAALADAQVTMKDIGVMAAGCLMGQGGIGQMIQKQVGQTGIPVYNVSNACATGATALRTAIMAIKAGECDMGLAVGVEKLAGVGLLGGGGNRKVDSDQSPMLTVLSAQQLCPEPLPKLEWNTATNTVGLPSNCSQRFQKRTTHTRH